MSQAHTHSQLTTEKPGTLLTTLLLTLVMLWSQPRNMDEECMVSI